MAIVGSQQWYRYKCGHSEDSGGESVDFITDCIANENSDSFNWAVKIHIKKLDGETIRDSVTDFHGPLPTDDYALLPIQVRLAWQTIYSRQPSDDELRMAVEYVAKQLNELHEHPEGISAGLTASKQVLANFCHVLMNSSEFVYVD